MLNHFEKNSFESQLFHNQIYYFFKNCSKGVSILYENQGLHEALTLGYIYMRWLLIILIIVKAIMKVFNYYNLTKLTRLLEYYLNIFNT